MTEALRGEGAHLKLPSGERFMARFDERMELCAAPYCGARHRS